MYVYIYIYIVYRPIVPFIGGVTAPPRMAAPTSTDKS